MNQILTALKADNLPTQKDEAWKYTPIAKAVPDNLQVADEKPIVIHRSCGQNSGKTEDILLHGKEGTLHNQSVEIVVEEGAALSVLESHDGHGAYWRNMQTRIHVKKGAKLVHTRLMLDDTQAVVSNMVDISVEEGAVYENFTLMTGGSLTRQQSHVSIKGSEAQVKFYGVTALEGKQLGDTTILIEHQAPHSHSEQFFRNVLADQAKGVFQGKVHVHKPAQKTDAQQLCKTLILNPRAEMNTKPELEIYADDVVCSHGATTGQIDDMALFYMRSRGIPEKQAKMLLTQAFVQEAMDKVSLEEVKLTICDIMEKWLLQN